MTGQIHHQKSQGGISRGQSPCNDFSGDDPIPDPAACRDLARAVFQRAMRDVKGRCLKGEAEKPGAVQDEALAWVLEAGEGFKFWAAVAGVDWRLVREQLLAGVGDRPVAAQRSRSVDGALPCRFGTAGRAWGMRELAIRTAHGQRNPGDYCDSRRKNNRLLWHNRGELSLRQGPDP